jgi:hypothetical protein
MLRTTVQRLQKRGLGDGEVRLDPHAIRPGTLREGVESEGFSFDTNVGGRSGYIARFRRASPRA